MTDEKPRLFLVSTDEGGPPYRRESDDQPPELTLMFSGMASIDRAAYDAASARARGKPAVVVLQRRGDSYSAHCMMPLVEDVEYFDDEKPVEHFDDESPDASLPLWQTRYKPKCPSRRPGSFVGAPMFRPLAPLRYRLAIYAIIFIAFTAAVSVVAAALYAILP